MRMGTMIIGLWFLGGILALGPSMAEAGSCQVCAISKRDCYRSATLEKKGCALECRGLDRDARRSCIDQCRAMREDAWLTCDGIRTDCTSICQSVVDLADSSCQGQCVEPLKTCLLAARDARRDCVVGCREVKRTEIGSCLGLEGAERRDCIASAIDLIAGCFGTCADGSAGGVSQCVIQVVPACVSACSEDIPVPGGCLPQEEVCNLVDDDCDGIIDNLPTPPEGCDTGLPGGCAVGTGECIFGRLVCVPMTLPAPEVCDLADNNCNGVTDERCPLP